MTCSLAPFYHLSLSWESCHVSWLQSPKQKKNLFTHEIKIFRKLVINSLKFNLSMNFFISVWISRRKKCWGRRRNRTGTAVLELRLPGREINLSFTQPFPFKKTGGSTFWYSFSGSPPSASHSPLQFSCSLTLTAVALIPIPILFGGTTSMRSGTTTISSFYFLKKKSIKLN